MTTPHQRVQPAAAKMNPLLTELTKCQTTFMSLTQICLLRNYMAEGKEYSRESQTLSHLVLQPMKLPMGSLQKNESWRMMTAQRHRLVLKKEKLSRYLRLAEPCLSMQMRVRAPQAI